MRGNPCIRFFGERKNARYTDRKGAYLIAIQDGKAAVVKTPKGCFLLGGGKEDGETDEACIMRESLEETGYAVKILKKICSAEAYIKHPQIGYFHPIQTFYSGSLVQQKQEPAGPDHSLQWVDYDLIKGHLFLEMQNWALKKCWEISCRKENSENGLPGKDTHDLYRYL